MTINQKESRYLLAMLQKRKSEISRKYNMDNLPSMIREELEIIKNSIQYIKANSWNY